MAEINTPQFAAENMSYNTPDGKPPDHRQMLIDLIASAHGPQSAMVAETAFKNQDSQIKEAMVEHGATAEQVLQSKGIDLNTLANPQKGFMGRWQDNFNKQEGNVTNTDVLGNLLKASEINKNNQSAKGFNTDESIAKLSKIQKSLEDSGLKDYQAEQTADGNFILKTKPVSMNDMVISIKEQQQQDKLEQSSIQRIASIRGDPSIAKVELSRDAAITAYNRIKDVQKSGQGLNPIDYVDILGQIYKARTGATPTNEIFQQARQDTAKGKFGKVYTFFTGKQSPATTDDIVKSLEDMSLAMGKQADKLHEGYMKVKLIKPKGLDQDRWDNIVKNNRGLSFSEATKSNDEPSGDNKSSGKTITLPSGKTITLGQ